MRKYKILLSFLFIVLYLLWFYFSYDSFRKSREVRLADINLTVINLKEKISIDNKKLSSSTFTLWDLEVNKILEDRKNKENEALEQKLNQMNLNSSQTELSSNFNLTKRKICLEKRCWEFMGMVSIGNKTQVTLLSTDEKPKLETFSVGDELLKGLIISNIKGDSMSVISKEKNKKIFTIKLFEVNASAYSPKNIKEIND